MKFWPPEVHFCTYSIFFLHENSDVVSKFKHILSFKKKHWGKSIHIEEFLRYSSSVDFA